MKNDLICLTRRGALALPLAGIALGARAAPLIEHLIEPAIEPGAKDLSKSLEPPSVLRDSHLNSSLEGLHDLPKQRAVEEAQSRFETARSDLKDPNVPHIDVPRIFDQAKDLYRIFTSVVRVSADVVTLLHGMGDQATVADLLDAVQKVEPELATLTGFRQEAIESAIDFIRKTNSGNVDLAWIEQGIGFTRTAVLLCDAQLHTGEPAFGDEATYATALAVRLAALAAPGGGSGQMPPQAGSAPSLGGLQPSSLSYDSKTATLTAVIDGKTWTIDVRQLSKDVAKQLYQRLTQKMVAKLITVRLVALVPGVGPYIALCLLCYDLVKKA